MIVVALPTRNAEANAHLFASAADLAQTLAAAAEQGLSAHQASVRIADALNNSDGSGQRFDYVSPEPLPAWLKQATTLLAPLNRWLPPRACATSLHLRTVSPRIPSADASTAAALSKRSDPMLHLSSHQGDDSQCASCQRTPHTVSLVAVDPDPGGDPGRRAGRLWWICPTPWCLEALGKYLAQFSD